MTCSTMPAAAAAAHDCRSTVH